MGTRPAIWGRAGTAAVLAVAGCLFTVANHQEMASRPETELARHELIADVARRQAEADGLRLRAGRLREEISDWDRRAGIGASDLALLRERAAMAGLVEVSGDGVLVTLTDAPATDDPVTGRRVPNVAGTIVDRDVQEVVNQLWALGAEAIAVNGERLTSVSAIRSAGGVILVDFRPVASPYRVEAIGERTLDVAFDRSPTAVALRSYARDYHLGFAVRRCGGLVLAPAPENWHGLATTPSSAVGNTETPSPLGG